MEVSRDVKLALSYISDAEQKFERMKHNDNEWMVEDTAEEIIGGELAKAEQHLQSADGSDDVLAARARLLKIYADVAMQVAAQGEVWKRLDQYKEKWARWANLSTKKHGELVSLAPTPANYYAYGFALYFADMDQQALEPLRVAEKSGDDDLSIAATKLIAQIEEQLASKPAPPVSTPPRTGCCGIIFMSALTAAGALVGVACQFFGG